MSAMRCAWLAGCDEPPAYLGFYEPCWAPGCSDGCTGAPVCEEHAAAERATNPDLRRLTAIQVSA